MDSLHEFAAAQSLGSSLQQRPGSFLDLVETELCHSQSVTVLRSKRILAAARKGCNAGVRKKAKQ
jgi:hypothetical protein